MVTAEDATESNEPYHYKKKKKKWSTMEVLEHMT